MRILVIAMILASGSTFAPSPTKMQLAARRPPTPAVAVAMVWRPPSFFEKEPSLYELLVCPHPCAPLCSTHACTSRIG